MGISGGSTFYHSITKPRLGGFDKIGPPNSSNYIECNWVANYLLRLWGKFVDHIIRNLSTVSLGNDTNPGCIVWIGPTALANEITK